MYMTTGNPYTYSMIITNYANRIYVAIMNTDLKDFPGYTFLPKTVAAAKASHMYVHMYIRVYIAMKYCKL